MVLTEREGGWGERFSHLVRDFDQANHDSARSLRSLLTEDAGRFLHSAAAFLCEPEESGAHRFVAMLVARNELALTLLTDSELLSIEEAIMAARRLLPFEPALERKLVKALQAESGALSDRLLDIVAAITPQERVEAVLSPLVQHADPNIRAAVIPVLTRRTGSLRWALSNVTQANPRIRAASVRALWDVRSQAVTPIIQRAAADPHPSVAANGLIGLYRLGESASLALMESLSRHSDPAFRAAAAEAMCVTADTRFAPSLKHLLQDPVPAVRSHAIRSLAQLKRAHSMQSITRKLQIEIQRIEADAGEVTIWLQVLTEAGEPVRHLQPVQFSIWDGLQPVLNYSVAETGGPGPLAVGFGLWRSHSVSETYWNAAEQGLEACLDLKSPLHAWSVVKVSKPEQDLGGALELPPHESLLTQPDPMLDTSVALIVTSSRSAASRHVILLVHPDSADANHTQTIIDAALRNQVAVHIISPAPVPEDNPLRQFEKLPGSSLNVARTPDEVVSVYLDVYRSLLNCHAVKFRLPELDRPHELRIEVDCEHGRGVQPLTFAAPQGETGAT